jgi:hypothetical protein
MYTAVRQALSLQGTYQEGGTDKRRVSLGEAYARTMEVYLAHDGSMLLDDKLPDYPILS